MQTYTHLHVLRVMNHMRNLRTSDKNVRFQTVLVAITIAISKWPEGHLCDHLSTCIVLQLY